MVKLITTAALVLVSLVTSAQTQFEKGMGNALKLWGEGKNTEAIAQFERIVNDSGFIKLQRLTEDEIIGTDGKQGLLEQYLTLSREVGTPMQDIALGGEEIRIGNKRLCLHTLSDTDDLPGTVSADTRFEKLSTDRRPRLVGRWHPPLARTRRLAAETWRMRRVPQR